MRVVRTQTDDGVRLLGRVLADKDVPEIRKRLDIASPESKLDAAEVMKRILNGEIAELANGWKLKRVTVAQDLRIEFLNLPYANSRPATDALVRSGVIMERISWQDRYFLPTGAKGVPVLQTLLQSKPLVALSTPGAAGAAGDGGPTGASSMFSARASAPEKQFPLKQIERLVQAALRGVKNAPVIRVAVNPEAIGEVTLDETVPSGVTLASGDIYVFQSGIGSALDVERVVFHELLHKGIQNSIPRADYVAVMQGLAKTDSKVRQYLLANPGSFTPNVGREAALVTVARPEQITQDLATQTKRSAEMDQFQQFSTVPALAFAANWVANVQPQDLLLEPSAGVGGLAVFARNAGAQLVLNELSSRRAAVLQELFPSARVFHENAEQLDNILPEDIVPTLVVMNPPFSSTAGRLDSSHNSSQIGAQHIEQALQRLAPGGRLVAIVGQGMAMDKATFKGWWNRMQKDHAVRAVVPMDGAGYVKYGTNFDNVLLVIDKIKPDGAPVVTTPAKSYTELIGLLEKTRHERPASNPRLDSSAERDAAESARQDAIPAGENATGRLGPDPARPDTLGERPPGQPGPAVAAGGGGRGGASTRRPHGPVRDSGGAGHGAGEQPGEGRAPVPDERGGLGAATGQPGTGLSVGGEQNQAGELGRSIFEAYAPQRLQIPGARAHPGALVQSAAMASVLPPKASYTPNLPQATIEQGLLSLAQLEAVVYAGQAHQELLNDKVDAIAALEHGLKAGTPYRRGFFIGDGTGVGKGREIAGIIMDNWRQGRHKAIWISEKQPLIEDAKRCLWKYLHKQRYAKNPVMRSSGTT